MSSRNLPGDRLPGDRLPGDTVQPVNQTSDPVAAEIEAEIADHLATAAETLEQSGTARDEAQQKVLERFGDVAAIGRRCYWVKQGDSIMYRAAFAVLIVALCLGLAVTTIGSWQSQNRMADQMNALAQQLKTLAESQKAVPAGPAPLEISGKIYAGSPDKPVPDAEVTICRVSDGEVVRRVRADKQGTYRSGPLPEGDYSILSPFEHDPRRSMQGAPVYLYSAIDGENRNLNTVLGKGRLKFEFSRLPEFEKGRGRPSVSKLTARLSTSRQQTCRWISQFRTPSEWPILISFPEKNELRASSNTEYFQVSNPPQEELAYTGLLLEGEWRIVPWLLLEAIDTGETFLEAEKSQFLTAPQARIRVHPGMATRLRVEVPDDLEEKVGLFGLITDENERFAAMHAEDPYRRIVKLTVLGTEPLPVETK